MFRTAFRASFSPLRVAPVLPPRSFAIARRFITDEARQNLSRAVESTPVVLFMKGTPEQPQCGFSRAAIQILEMQGVPPEKFKSFNVLEDTQLRSDIKEFSDWPTIPQLYVNGEFVGGCDILLSMHQNGELEKLLEEKGVLPPLEAEAQPQSASA
ncbi:glutaredoxin [Phanerochaete sordida]|uniref:Monothiol glutaredoxin-5, mitochondrial n=1 Tax=Phanerochaete sordida TaxID=48140 RepID=A0A9P3LM27_9APHY|nr:glutaredoxin [Phanerochaete sordida]